MRISDWSSDVCSSDLASSTRSNRLETLSMQSSTVTRATSELQTHQFRERAAASTMARESQFPGGSSAGPLAPLRSNAYSREMTSGTPAAAIAPIDMTIDELRGALARVLPFHAAFDGWTDAALAPSARGLHGRAERARPEGRG